MDNQTKVEPLVVKEEFTVPAEKLYKAWTEESELKKWWKPMETALTSVRSEMKTGGAIEYQFDNADFTVGGKYESVEPNTSLKYSWEWIFKANELKNERYSLDIGFAEKDGRTTLTVHQDGFKNEEDRKAHEEGWKTGLQQLHNYLNG